VYLFFNHGFESCPDGYCIPDNIEHSVYQNFQFKDAKSSKKRREAAFFNRGSVQGVRAIMTSPVRTDEFARYEVRTAGARPKGGGKGTNG
jgi:hypothetical protein